MSAAVTLGHSGKLIFLFLSLQPSASSAVRAPASAALLTLLLCELPDSTRAGDGATPSSA